MTVWAPSPTVKIYPAQGNVHPDAGLDLDASVTSRDGLCTTGPSRGPSAEERPRCVEIPQKTGFVAPVRPGAEQRSDSAHRGLGAARRPCGAVLVFVVEAIALVGVAAPKVTFGGAR